MDYFKQNVATLPQSLRDIMLHELEPRKSPESTLNLEDGRNILTASGVDVEALHQAGGRISPSADAAMVAMLLRNPMDNPPDSVMHELLRSAKAALQTVGDAAKRVISGGGKTVIPGM